MKNLSPVSKQSTTLATRFISITQPSGIDLSLLGCCVILSLFGLLMVYDASQAEALQDIGDKYFFIRQQGIWEVLGFLGLGFFSLFDYRRLQKIAVPLFAISLVLLLLVFVPNLGVSAGGAHRWLRISFLTIQPIEIIKLSSILFFASFLERKVKTLPFVAMLGFVVIIVGVLQKDLGSAIVYSLISFGLYFLAGGQVRYLLSLIGTGVLGFIVFIVTSSYRKQRILAFLDPFVDPQGYSYHISQVLIALGSGGLFGLGIGQSRQKFSYIPEITTDSIFSVIGEELGLLGGLVLISLIAFLILRAFRIAERAPDNFGKLLAGGIALWLGAQAVVNLAAMVSLIPLTGVPLPFISYGGSALLTDLVAVGILLNISRRSQL